MALSTLVVKLVTEHGELIKGLDTAAGSVKKFVGDTAKSIKGLSLTDLKSGFELAGMAAEGLGTVYNALVGDTMEYAKQTRDLSTNLGISAEETSSLIQAADDYGISVDEITNALQMSVKKGMKPSIETLAKMADEYVSIADPVERAAKLTDVFGKNWTTLTPLLKEGGQAIRDSAAEAKALGLTLSEVDVQAARQLEIEVDNLGDKFEALKLKVGKAVIPVLNEAATTFGYLTDGIGSADALENQYTQAIAVATLAQGANSMAVEVAIKALREYLLLKQTLGMSANEQALRANMAEVKSLGEVATGADTSGAATRAYSNELLYNVQQYQAQQVAAENAAKAEAVHRGSIAESITANASLAQSLKSATSAQATQTLATAQLDTLTKAYQTGTISQKDYEKATEAVMLRYGLATPQSIAMSEAQVAINKAFIDGDLPLQKYIDSTGKIPAIARDGKVTLQELTDLGIKPSTAAAEAQKLVIDDMVEVWGRVPPLVTTKYKIVTEGEMPSGGGTSAPSRAMGGPTGNGGLFRLHPNEYVLSEAMRLGRAPIPAAAISAQANGVRGGQTTINNNNFYDTLSTKMFLEQQRAASLQRIAERM